MAGQSKFKPPDPLCNCGLCGMEVRESEMKRHLKYDHNGKVPCTFCGIQVRIRYHWEHLQKFHQGLTGKLNRSSSVPPRSDPIIKIDFEEELHSLKNGKDHSIILKTKFGLLYDEVNNSVIAGLEHLVPEDLANNLDGTEQLTFYIEPELKISITPGSYNKMGKVNGHVVPAASYRLKKEDHDDTFSMANVYAQDFCVNSGVMLQVENHARELLQFWDEVIIVTGPVFDYTQKKQKTLNLLEIYMPVQFFKIILMKRSGETPRIQAFLIDAEYDGIPFFIKRTTVEKIVACTDLDLSLFAGYPYTWDENVIYHVCHHLRCGRTFTDEADLLNHLKNHPWKCKICHRCFPTANDLTLHIETHRDKVCGVCGRAFLKQAHLISHERIHTGVKPYECDVGDCTAKFATRSNLKQHEDEVHKQIKNHKCPYTNCGRAFPTKAKLKKHEDVVHKKIKNHECPYTNCGSRFATKSALKGHEDSVHKKIKGFHCGCGKRYAKKQDLVHHQKTCSYKTIIKLAPDDTPSKNHLAPPPPPPNQRQIPAVPSFTRQRSVGRITPAVTPGNLPATNPVVPQQPNRRVIPAAVGTPAQDEEDDDFSLVDWGPDFMSPQSSPAPAASSLNQMVPASTTPRDTSSTSTASSASTTKRMPVSNMRHVVIGASTQNRMVPASTATRVSRLSGSATTPVILPASNTNRVVPSSSSSSKKAKRQRTPSPTSTKAIKHGTFDDGKTRKITTLFKVVPTKK